MTTPDVNLTFLDGKLGILPAETDGIVAVLGVSTKGKLNSLNGFSGATVSQMLSTLGLGKGPQLVAHLLETEKHGPIYYFPIASVAGVNSAVTPSSSSAPAVTVTGNPMDDIEGIVKMVTGGTRGTATFQFSLDYGLNWSGVLTTAASYVTDVGLSLTAVTASGTTPPTITLTGTPLRYVNLRVECTVLGARGTSKVRVSTDGGKTWGAEVLTAATLAVTDPDGTATGVTLNIATDHDASVDNVWTASTQGMTINFASGTYVKDDTYSWTSAAPIASNTHVTNALDALKALRLDVGCVYVTNAVGGTLDSDRATAMSSAFSAVDTKIVALAAKPSYKFTVGIIEAPAPVDYTTPSGMTAWRTAMVTGQVGLSSKVTGICAGYVRITSPIDARQYRRSIGWLVVARISWVPIGEHLGRIASGACGGAVAGTLDHDEDRDGLLDDARFITARTLSGADGIFITRGRQMAPQGSDYEATHHLRVINRVAKVGRNALLRYLNDDEIVNKATGKIREDEAISIDEDITSQLLDAVVHNNQSSDAAGRVSRSDDILSTNTLTGDFAVVPKGYNEAINFSLGFSKTLS